MYRHISSSLGSKIISSKTLSAASSVPISSSCRRHLATVSPSIIAQPPPPEPPVPQFEDALPPLLDYRILEATSRAGRTSLPNIIKQYVNASGNVLDSSLPYESRPSETRRPDFSNAADSCKLVVTVAHCAQVGLEHKITLSSGFALHLEEYTEKGEMVIVTCAHTLEEIRQSPLMLSSPTSSSRKFTGSFIVTGSGDSAKVYPVSRVISALPRSDLILLSCPMPTGVMKTMPISPYPAHRDTNIRAHFVSPFRPDDSGWMPWIGGTWGKWHAGKVMGYRDFAGRESEPGTYDALSHLLFTPLPTAGSSGGPIIDEESGAVIGIMLGTRMDNRVEGVRGWGVPSETVFEMFSLPGLEGKK